MTALQDTLVNVPLTNGAHIPGDHATVVMQLQEPMAVALQALRSAETALTQLLACESATYTFNSQSKDTGKEHGSSTHGGGVTLGIPAVATAESQTASGVLRSTQLLGELSSTVAQELSLLLEVVGQVSRLSDVQLQMHSTVAHMLQLGREQR